jgi:hypothetical protein
MAARPVRREPVRVADDRVVDRPALNRGCRLRGEHAVGRSVDIREIRVDLVDRHLGAAEVERRDVGVVVPGCRERIADGRGGDRHGRTDGQRENDGQGGNEESAGHGTRLRRERGSYRNGEARRDWGRVQQCRIYSPTTAQMRPIMMKSPTNIEIRPMPP